MVPEASDATARLRPSDTDTDGFAIETTVLARLLGIKLLTLEGVVLVSPAQVRASNVVSQGPTGAPTTETGRAITSSNSRAHLGMGPGHGLEDAARLLNECTKDLQALER